jgi:hypothetical protein
MMCFGEKFQWAFASGGSYMDDFIEFMNGSWDKMCIFAQ